MTDVEHNTPPSGPDKPGRVILEGVEIFRSYCAEMAERASARIEIYTRDLEPQIYDRKEFLEALKDLSLRTRGLAVRILLNDNELVQRQGHGLVNLARRLPSSIQIRKTHPDFREHHETFMVVDRCRYVRRALNDRYQGEADPLDRLTAQRMLEFFDSAWDHSESDSELRGIYI